MASFRVYCPYHPKVVEAIRGSRMGGTTGIPFCTKKFSDLDKAWILSPTSRNRKTFSLLEVETIEANLREIASKWGPVLALSEKPPDTGWDIGNTLGVDPHYSGTVEGFGALHTFHGGQWLGLRSLNQNGRGVYIPVEAWAFDWRDMPEEEDEPPDWPQDARAPNAFLGINQSGMGVFTKCPYLYFCNKVLKLALPINRMMLIGTAAHAGAETLHIEMMEKGYVDGTSLEKAIDACFEITNLSPELKKLDQKPREDDKVEFQRFASGMVTHYHALLLDEPIQILGTERKVAAPVGLSFTYDERTIPVHFFGTLDLNYDLNSGETVVSDIKTTIGRPPSAVARVLTYMRQLGLYSLLAKLVWKQQPRFSEIRDLNPFEGPRVTRIPIAPLLQQAVPRIRNTTKQMIYSFREGYWPRRTGIHCKTCPIRVGCLLSYIGQIEVSAMAGSSQ